jgi:CRP-like cAMP-binding protein
MMTTHIEPSTLRDVELFVGMLDGEIEEILEVGQIETVSAGEMIYEPGKRRQALYVLLEGELEIDLQLPGLGERMLLAILPGGVFGEVSFFYPGPHSATVRCMADAQLLRLDRPEFVQMAEQGRTSAFKLTMNAARLLAARLAATDQFMGAVLEHTERATVAESWRNFRSSLTPTHHAGGISQPGGW